MAYAKASAFSGGSGGVTDFTDLGDVPASYSGQATKVVRVNAGETALEFFTLAAGSGDVVGPGSATDNAIARYDLTTGKLLQNSVVTIGDTGIIAGATGFTSSGTINFSGLTASTVPYSDASKNLVSSAVTPTELGYVSGVTSAIQTQLNAKAPTASPTFSGTVTTPVTASRALVTGASSELAASATTSTELGYVSGVTSAIQTQLNAKEASISVSSQAGNFTAAGNTIYLVSSAASRNITLPAAASGTKFWIKDSTGSCGTNNFTIVRAASESIEGIAANRILQSDWGSWMLVCDGTNWFII